MENIFKYLDRIDRMNFLILHRATGSPDKFSRKLKISKRQLFNDMDVLKLKGAEIKYNRTLGTYYYENDFNLEISIKY